MLGAGDAKKGFYIVDISSGNAVTNWIQLDTRKQVRINANAKSLETQIDKLVEEMDNDGQKPIVDLRLNDVANPEMVRAQLARLEGRAFHTSWREQQDDSSADVLLVRPTDTESEMLRLASESLATSFNRSTSLAKVAINDLLEPLARADMTESNSIILKEYENYKKRNPL